MKIFRPSNIKFASKSQVPIYAVDYRLAPEHPFPKPVEDAYAALEWLHAHAGEENVDLARIGICGHSAGGDMAAGVALVARDKGLTPPLAKLTLIYPMLDDRTVVKPEERLPR